MDKINKIAQRRGRFNKLREKTNITGKILETLNSEFAEVMNRMRETDDAAREHADELKQIVRNTKQLFRRRDYLACAVNISSFHERCRLINHQLSKFSNSINLKHYEFLLQQLDEENKEKLFNYDPEFAFKEASFFEAITKDAGVKDFWFNIIDPVSDTAHNLFTERGQSMRAMEKRFSNTFLKQLKKSTEIMVDRTERMLHILLSIFKDLATARAKRNVNLYTDACKRFEKKFQTYHKIFSDFHKNTIQPLKEQQAKFEEEARQAEENKSKQLEQNADELRKIKEFKTQEVQKQPQQISTQEALQNLEKEQGSIHDEVALENERKHQENISRQMEEAAAEKRKKEEAAQLMAKNTLEKLKKDNELEEIAAADDGATSVQIATTGYDDNLISNLSINAENNDVDKMIKEILSASEKFENIDANKSTILLNIAKNIINDKHAGIFDIFKKKDDDLNLKPGEEFKPLFPKEEKPITQEKKHVEHGLIDSRKINKPFASFDFLKNILPTNMRTTPNSEANITETFIQNVLRHTNLDESLFDNVTKEKIIAYLKKAVYDGQLVSVSAVADSHNPKDRYLEVFGKVNLSNISNKLNGTADLKIYCRLSASNGQLTLRTIQKSFQVK